MDVVTPFCAGVIVAVIIWGVAWFFDRKQKAKKQKAIVSVDDLYEDE